MELACRPRHHLAFARQEDPGPAGEDHQRQRRECERARPLLPLARFHHRAGERRGHGGTRARRPEMICRLSPHAAAARRTFFRWFGFSLLAPTLFAQRLEPDRVDTVIEALTRLGPEKVNADPKLKEALRKVLEATKGTSQFVELVRDFGIRDHTPALLDVAIKNPNNSTGADAARLIIECRDFALLKNSLDSTNALTTVKVLGNTDDKRIVPLLEPLVGDLKRDAGLRKQAVRSLAQIQAGAVSLLKLAREEKLPDDLKFTATSEL